ncbi:MAG: methyl-accepting chemotaxis protein, partial [Thalassolituus sp.]
MAWFSQLKVFHKIMLILVVYAISATTSFFIGANGVNETKDYIIRLEEKIYESVQLATKNSFLLQRADEMFTQAVTAGDPEMVAQGEATVSELLVNVDRLLEIDKDNTQLLSSIQTSAQQYLTVSATLLNNLLSESPDFELLQKQGARKAELLDTTNTLLGDHKASVDELFASAIHGALTSSSNTLNIVTVTNIGFFIIMSLLIYYVGKVFSTTVNTMKHSLRALARGDGDLNTRLKVSTQDELGEMTQNFNAFMDKLNSTILQIKNIVPDLASAASSLGKGTADVQSMASLMRQKSSDAKHSMDEMSRSIQEVSHTANEASTVMQQTRDASAEGLSIVHTSIDNSRELNTQ